MLRKTLRACAISQPYTSADGEVSPAYYYETERGMVVFLMVDYYLPVHVRKAVRASVNETDGHQH